MSEEKSSSRGCLSVIAIAMLFGIGYAENKKCEAKWGDCSIPTMWKDTRQTLFGLNEEELAVKRRNFEARGGIRNRRVQIEVVTPPTQK